MMRQISGMGILACGIASGCGSSSSTGDGSTAGDTGVAVDTGSAPTADSGPVADSGPATDSALATDSGAPTDGSTGGSTVSGSADGTPFDTAAMALWLGAPDDPATTVVYVFSKPVKCSDLSTPGWDKRITNATQFLEMKMFGTTPATYKVTGSPTPAPGEAAVNYTLSSTAGVPKETAGTAGTVTLATVVATTDATGSFALTFGTHSVTGTYDATFCPGGHEP